MGIKKVQEMRSLKELMNGETKKPIQHSTVLLDFIKILF